MSRLLTCLILIVFVTSTYAFNNRDFRGRYAFRLVGPSSFVLANEPRTVGTGVLLADGKGKVEGHGTFRSAGARCEGQIKGNYTVKPDGTGILTSIFTTSTPGCFTSVLDLAIVLADQGNIFKVSTFENDYMIGTLTRQQRSVFNNSHFNGNYALHLEGPSSVVLANLPFTVGVGLIHANGNGKITGSATLRSAGVTCLGKLVGNYRVDPDGAGILTSNFTTNTPGCFSSALDFSIALYKRGNGAEAASIENDYLAGSLDQQ